MNDKSPEELIVRWMDGETLPPDELTTLKELHATDPSLVIDPREYVDVQQNLNEAYATAPPLPDPDLFQSTLMSRIGREVEAAQEAAQEAAAVVEEEQKEEQKAKVVHRFAWIQTAAAMAACFLLGIIISRTLFKPSRTSEVMASYNDQATQYAQTQLQPVVHSAHDHVTAEFLSDEELSVIIVQGLEDIPDNMDLFALTPAQARVSAAIPTPQVTSPQPVISAAAPQLAANHLPPSLQALTEATSATAQGQPTPAPNALGATAPTSASPPAQSQPTISQNATAPGKLSPIKVYPNITYPDL